MEQAVAGERLLLMLEFAVHLIQRLLDGGDLRLLRGLRRERRAFAFDRVAGAHQLERTGERVHLAAARATRVRLVTFRGEPRTQHVDPGPDAHFDQPLDFERDQRLAHRRARNPELLREIALRRQPRAGHELAGADQLPDLVRDLPVEPARFDALEWHGARECGSAAPLFGARAARLTLPR